MFFQWLREVVTQTLTLIVNLGCLGRRFAHVEAICFLANLLREWRLDVELEGGETRGEYEKRILEKAVVGGLSLGIGSVSVRLTRRAVV